MGRRLYFGPGRRFQGGQIGVTLPLLGQAQKSRINAARIGEQIAQTDLQNQRFALDQQVQQAVQQYDQYRSALTYYEANGLNQADLILTNARRAFSGGDIGYVEFSLALAAGPHHPVQLFRPAQPVQSIGSLHQLPAG